MASLGLSSGIMGKELIKSQFCKDMHTENTNFPSSQEKEGVQNFKIKLEMWKHTKSSIKCCHKAIFARFWDL